MNGLRRALGIPGKYEVDDAEDEYPTADGVRTPYVNPFKKTSEPSEVVSPIVEKEPVAKQNDEEGLPSGIFDNLIGVINANLSPVVKNCIDVEAQKKFLYETLGTDFRNFIDETHKKALSEAAEKWNVERESFISQLSEMKTTKEQTEAKAAEIKEQQLGMERQKRAAEVRTRELEGRIASLEAEHEQFELENKSLMNKLKVSQVYSADAAEAQKEVEKLRADLNEAKSKLTASVDKDDYEKQLADANAIIANLRGSIAERNLEYEKTLGVLADKTKAMAEVQAELDEANTNLEIASEIQSQLEKVEEFKKKKNEEIDRLKQKILEIETQKDKSAAATEQKLAIVQEKEQSLSQQVATLTAKLDESRRQKEDSQLEFEIRVEELKSQLAAASDVIEQKSDAVAKAHELSDSLNKEIGELRLSKDKAVDDLNRAKVEALEKSQRLEAEIAELQARLNVNGNIDDSLVDSDLRQAVEDTFGISFDSPVSDLADSDSAFDTKSEEVVENIIGLEQQKDEVEEPVQPYSVLDADVDAAAADAETLLQPVVAPESLTNSVEEPVENVEEDGLSDEFSSNNGETGMEEIDDIDWLIPTPPSESKQKKEETQEKMQDTTASSNPKNSQEDAQMSLF